MNIFGWGGGGEPPAAMSLLEMQCSASCVPWVRAYAIPAIQHSFCLNFCFFNHVLKNSWHRSGTRMLLKIRVIYLLTWFYIRFKCVFKTLRLIYCIAEAHVAWGFPPALGGEDMMMLLPAEINYIIGKTLITAV